MTRDYDVVVIGAGNAGQGAAGVAREAGRSVAVIEADLVGGTCPNRGCVPKKVLVAAAEALDVIARAGSHHIEVAGASLDWPALIRRKRAIVEPLPGEMAASLARRGIDLVRGAARFRGPDTVEVAGETLRGAHIVVATGSVTRRLPIDGADLMMTSDEFLEMDALPSSIAFVGAGVIAMEFAHVLARAGVKVTLLEVAPRPLAQLDADAVAALVAYSRTLGIDIHTGVEVEQIAAHGDRLTVQYRDAGAAVTLEVDRIVNGAGRVANLDGLDLDAAGIAVDRGRVALDDTLRSKDNPRVYFAGDAVTGAPQLSPVATYEGRIVGHNLVDDEPRTPDYSTWPSAVFTVPALAQVGLTEEQARDQGVNVVAKESDIRGWISARSYGEEAAYAKVLVDQDSRRIVGAHLLGHGAAETIHLFAMAMRCGITADELARGEYVYPTFSNDVKFLV